MKVCPKCRQTYSDDKQSFCLNDGAALLPVNAGGENQTPETVMVNQAPPTNPNQPSLNQPQFESGFNAPSPQFSMQPQAARRGGGSKTWIWVVGILGVLVLLCGGGLIGAYFWAAGQIENTINTINAYSSPTPSGTNVSTSPASSSQVLSLDKFNLIKNGMSRSEVEGILGGAGNEISSTKAGSYTIATHEWKGEEYSVIYVVFRNDKVFSKTSANLK